MKNILVKIGSINRRIIFILIALSVLIPLLKPDWFNFPIKIDKNTELYVRFEANPPSSNVNQHNSEKSQNSQNSSDSWVGASVNS